MMGGRGLTFRKALERDRPRDQSQYLPRWFLVAPTLRVGYDHKPQDLTVKIISNDVEIEMAKLLN